MQFSGVQIGEGNLHVKRSGMLVDSLTDRVNHELWSHLATILRGQGIFYIKEKYRCLSVSWRNLLGVKPRITPRLVALSG